MGSWLAQLFCFILLFIQISYLAEHGFSIDEPSCLDIERKALLKFKTSLADPSGRLSSWFGEDCCAWKGVQCSDKTGHVLELNLGNSFSSISDDNSDGIVHHELSGKINPSLLDLKYLNHLDLSMNKFQGNQIPEYIGWLTELRYLNLSGSSFSGPLPKSLGNLTKLVYLDLGSREDEVTDQVSDLQWLPNLSSLNYLNLRGLDLSKAATYWFKAISSLPSIVKLHMPNCQLSILPPYPYFPENMTSLSVLDLSNNRFNSSIPHWLSNLTSLISLDLSSNDLYGVIPESFSKLGFLRSLDLSSNYEIQGEMSKSLGSLCSLQILSLGNNRITGELDDFLDSLSECKNSSLVTLDLGNNQLYGRLPCSIGSFQSLQNIQLRGNLLSGPIPETVGNLSCLEEFYLSENQLSGKIPSSLGQLSSLVTIDLSGGNFWEGVITETHLMNLSSLQEISIGTFLAENISLVFNISSNWLPPFRLRFIKIWSCQLGPKFPTWIRNQSSLQTLIFTKTMISDTIPNWFLELNLQLNELELAYNQLSGKVPNSFQFNVQANVDLSSNFFQGHLPLWSSNVSTLYLRDNLFSGAIPENFGLMLPSLTDLDISRNALTGPIPLSVGNLTEMLNLQFSNNRLAGEIPDIWHSLPNLYSLDISNNSLSRKLPSSIGSLSSLRFLQLSSNNLSGELPSMRNCSLLISLDLGDNLFSGKIPAWIGESLPKLLIIRMRSNLLTGNIPLTICSLPGLHILDLSINQFSGSIPGCIGNLSGYASEFTDEDIVEFQGNGLEVIAKGRLLRYRSSALYLVNSIDLSNNNLFGGIPPGLINLSRIGTLNLSRNHLTGPIPADVGKFEWIETLDLSGNQFTGTIPPSMAFLTFLSHLNLSFNRLSGRIPTGNQFNTFTDPTIYEGNLALCGFPLAIECGDGSGTNPATDGIIDKNKDDNERLEKSLFIAVIALGYSVGFWGVCGTLILKRNWRDSYFSFLTRNKDKLVQIISSNFLRR